MLNLRQNIPCLRKGSSLIETHEGTFSQDIACLLLINVYKGNKIFEILYIVC